MCALIGSGGRASAEWQRLVEGRHRLRRDGRGAEHVEVVEHLLHLVGVGNDIGLAVVVPVGGIRHQGCGLCGGRRGQRGRWAPLGGPVGVEAGCSSPDRSELRLGGEERVPSDCVVVAGVDGERRSLEGQPPLWDRPAALLEGGVGDGETAVGRLPVRVPPLRTQGTNDHGRRVDRVLEGSDAVRVEGEHCFDDLASQGFDLTLHGLVLVLARLRVDPPVVRGELPLVHPPGLVAEQAGVDAVVQLLGPARDVAAIELAVEEDKSVELVDEAAEVRIFVALHSPVRVLVPLVLEPVLDLRVRHERAVRVADVDRDARVQVALLGDDRYEERVDLLLECAQVRVERERARARHADGLELGLGFLVARLGLRRGRQVDPHGVRAEELDPDGEGLEDDEEGLDPVARAAHVRVPGHELREDPALVQDSQLHPPRGLVLAGKRVGVRVHDLASPGLALGGERRHLVIDLVVENLELAGGRGFEGVAGAFLRLLVGQLGAVGGASAAPP